MDNKDIEKKLNSDAKNIKKKDFSLRWKEIQAQMNVIGSKENDTVSVLIPVNVTNNAGNENKKRQSLKLLPIILTISLMLILAVVLPVVLIKNNEKVYFNEGQLSYESVTETEFYSGLKESNIEIINLSKLNLENYRLFYSDSNEIKGGGFESIDEDLGCYSAVVFYDSSVTVNDIIEFEVYNIKNLEIKYHLTETEGYYAMTATTVVEKVFYRFNCSMVENNAYEIFNKFFGE